MISFLISLALLILGYIFYGKFVEKLVAPDAERKTPAYVKQDGVDYIPMPTWKIFMIQFLNIAGLGPIFGAILGAKFGIAAYIWIVLGCIFIGAAHDYISGMMSLRMDGANLPDIVGKFLGDKTKTAMRIFTVILMVMVGAVFVSGPAAILNKITPESLDVNFWIGAIFLYYVIATLLPIDAIIGKFYPIFAIALIFMALGVFCMLLFGGYGMTLPEFTDGLSNTHPAAESTPIFPIMCITIACGAISGFHATQSPLMARCLKNENLGRKVFYGSMILEGVMALIWAAAAIWYYQENGLEEGNASLIVDFITNTFLGKVGAVLALLGVVFAPITSGDTALRSCRLILADFLKLDQRKISKRLAISIPLFLACAGVIVYSLHDKDGFNIIWRYFGWSNQVLAVFTLWSITVYLHNERKKWLVGFIPAVFMTMVCSTYLFIAPECFALNHTLSYILGATLTIVCMALFWMKFGRKA